MVSKTGQTGRRAVGALGQLSTRIEFRQIRTAGADQIGIDVDFGSAGPAPSPLGIGALLEALTVVTSFGAFGPSFNYSSPTASASRPSSRTMRCNFMLPPAPGCWSAIYRSLAFALTYADVSARVVIYSDAPASAFARAFSPVPLPELPFDVDVSVRSDEVLYRLEFVREPSVSEKATLAAPLQAWSTLAAAGAFEAQSGVPSRALLLPDGEPAWLLEELWWRHVRVAVDEAAFAPLLSIASSIHQSLCPVQSFRIG